MTDSTYAPNTGMGGGWGGLRTTPEFVNLFESINTDYTSTKVGTSPDKRAQFFVRISDANRLDKKGNPRKGSNGKLLVFTDQTLNIADIGAFTNGWGVVKYTNVNNDGTRPTPYNDFVNTDFPIFRLADIYLMYAEAVLRGGSGGDLAVALSHVNDLRSRAYGNTSGNVSSIDLPFILAERGRELYWEAIRRTDLVRFGQLTNGDYVWSWKGNVQAGAKTGAYRNLYPIPTQDMVNNPNLVQNTGY
jgi:hypothetical protein